MRANLDATMHALKYTDAAEECVNTYKHTIRAQIYRTQKAYVR